VGLVQANILQDEKWEPGKAQENFDRHVQLTRRAASSGARLVVWPESAVPHYFDLSPALAEELRELVRSHGIYLIFGNDDMDVGEGLDRRVWVGAKMLTPGGELPFRYHKIRLVPFGEYVPMEALLSRAGVKKLVRQVGAFTPGTEPRVGHVDGRGFGAFICYEAIFPDLVREFVARGADLLVNITNDAWYGWTSAPYQHFAMAIFRAVENRKYLIRSANTGITAVVDPHGRVLEQTRLFEPAVLVRDVALVPGRTFYTRHGDLFAWGCLAAAVAFTAGTLRLGRG
jgi:apolipoprotein N-acyltransferase